MERLRACLACVALAACAPLPSHRARYSAPAPQSVLVREAPQRPRFIYEPRPRPQGELGVAFLNLVLIDQRLEVAALHGRPALKLATSDRVQEVPLPPGFERDVQNHINEVIASSGVPAELHVKPTTAHVVRAGTAQRAKVAFLMDLVVHGTRVAGGSGEGYRDLLGPAHDDAEMDEIFRAAALDAFDAFLMSDVNIAILNENIARFTGTPAPPRPNLTAGVSAESGVAMQRQNLQLVHVGAARDPIAVGGEGEFLARSGLAPRNACCNSAGYRSPGQQPASSF